MSRVQQFSAIAFPGIAEVHPSVRQPATGQLSIGWFLLANEEDLVTE
jgi:hypothetical protein